MIGCSIVQARSLSLPWSVIHIQLKVVQVQHNKKRRRKNVSIDPVASSGIGRGRNTHECLSLTPFFFVSGCFILRSILSLDTIGSGERGRERERTKSVEMCLEMPSRLIIVSCFHWFVECFLRYCYCCEQRTLQIFCNFFFLLLEKSEKYKKIEEKNEIIKKDIKVCDFPRSKVYLFKNHTSQGKILNWDWVQTEWNNSKTRPQFTKCERRILVN